MRAKAALLRAAATGDLEGVERELGAGTDAGCQDRKRSQSALRSGRGTVGGGS